MNFVFYTNTVSPHQLPWIRELKRSIGKDACRYIFTDRLASSRTGMGWSESLEDWIICENDDYDKSRRTLQSFEMMISENRDLDLFEQRLKAGKITIYESERWFKPWIAMFRLLKPSYFRMAWRFVKLLRISDKLLYYPMGVHAACDMARLCGLFAGDLRCLFRAPKLDFERKPGGRIYLASSSLQLPATATSKSKRYCLDKMRMWGYFVAPSQYLTPHAPIPNSSTLKVLWVGRLMKCKRVDTIIRAVGGIAQSQSPSNSNSNFHIQLDIYGAGQEENSLKKLASKYGDAIKFHPSVSISEVRKLMREHDVYILSSNGQEGWGAVVSEALEEGMVVLGTRSAGSCATILPEAHLFESGNHRALAKLLVDIHNGRISRSGIGNWTAANAAKGFLTK